MSHSRIFQLADEPIGEQYFCEITLGIADYINSLSEKEREISLVWLQNVCADRGIEFGTDKRGDYLIVRNKEKFFKEKFEEFKEAAKELANASLQDFADEHSGVGFYLLQLNYAFEDKFGFYFVTEDCSYARPFDYFVRDYADKDKKYYIGSAFDYHC